MTTIFEYCRTDILCVRGLQNEAMSHFGNVRYHKVILKYSNKYNKARYCERKQLLDEILDEIQQDGNTRFLKQKKCPAGHFIFWEELNKESIRKKIQKALFITEHRRKCYHEKTVEEVAGESKSSKKEKALASRRMKARHRYASMTPDQRQVYTSKCRERYQRRREISRAKRRELQRTRYHSIFGDDHNDNNTFSIDSQDGDDNGGGCDQETSGKNGVPIPSFAPLPNYSAVDDASSVGGSATASNGKGRERGPSFGFFVGGGAGDHDDDPEDTDHSICFEDDDHNDNNSVSIDSQDGDDSGGGYDQETSGKNGVPIPSFALPIYSGVDDASSVGCNSQYDGSQYSGNRPSFWSQRGGGGATASNGKGRERGPGFGFFVGGGAGDHDDAPEDMDSKEAAICLLQMGATDNTEDTDSTDDDTDDIEDTDDTNKNVDTDDICTAKQQQRQPMKERKKIVMADPAVQGIKVEDAIKLIAVVIADLSNRNAFVERLLRDYSVCKDQGESHSEEYVFFPGLTLTLINKHLGKSLPGTTIFLKTTSTIPSNSSGDGDEGTTTLVCGDDFSTWYLVEGTTNKNFQDAPAHHHYRPTVQSFLKEPGFMDCHPRKGVPPTTTTASDHKDAMEQRDLMAICLATSSVFTRLGPRGNHWQTDRFDSDFIPYPMSWLGSVITRLSSTTATVAESTMTPDNDSQDGPLTFSFTIGKKGSLLTSTQKVWGIRYANDATTSKTTTTTTIGTTTKTNTTSRTTLQAIQTPDYSHIFFPPDTLDGHSVDGDISIRREQFAHALNNNNKSSKPRCRHYVKGALYRNLDLADGGPLLWEPRKHGDLDLDIFVTDQLENKSSSPCYTTSRISVRRVDYEGNKENTQFLESCNSIGCHHASKKANCRKHNSDKGKMFGFGYHLYNGGIKKFTSKLCEKRVCKMLNQAKKVLEPLFPHQLISMRAIEQGLGICTTSRMPQAFNQSVDLGNASHVDVMDGSAGMSMWTELRPGTAKNWYFVLPNLIVTHDGTDYVGVVIKLDHGTTISWDGRLIRHCTSVTDVNGGDVEGENHVFGMFFSTKANTLGAQMNRG
jgi:hypothetical protein